MITYLRQIFHLLGPDRQSLPWLVLLFLVSSLFDLAGLGLIGPYITLIVDSHVLDGTLGRVVDWFGLPREQKPLLITLGIMLFGVFFCKAIFTIGIQWVIIRFSRKQQMRLQMFLMESYQALPYSLYLRRNSSEYIHSISGLTGQFSGVILNLLRCTSEGIVGLVILFLLLWKNGMALALLIVMLGMMVYSYDRIFRKNMSRYGKLINLAGIKMVQGIHEGIEGLKEIRVLGHENYFLNKVREGAQQSMHYTSLNQLILTAPRYILELMMISFIVLLVIIMLFLAGDLKALLPTLGIFGLAAMRLMPIANMLSGSLSQLRFSRDGVSRLYHDLEQIHSRTDLEIKKTSDSTKAQAPPKTFQVLEMKDLGFRYPNALVDALHGINLQIRSGESVGLVGPSGAGKTTMVDVLLGLLEPHIGNITFNGLALQEALLDWRSQTAYLPQQVFLIDNTLKRNVALGVEDDKIDEIRIHEALSQARLIELLDQLPKGVETLIGERGVRLSGGQRQRVALARAFYHQRGVLVMDEATSALDDSTEKEIVEEIKHLKGKITMIVIAHRLTTVQHCDRIYRLENGRLVEEGKPEQVLKMVG